MRKSASGFTLVELLIVMIIIGILGVITIVTYTGLIDRATTSSVKNDVVKMADNIRLIKAQNERFTGDDCTEIVSQITSVNPYPLQASDQDYYKPFGIFGIAYQPADAPTGWPQFSDPKTEIAIIAETVEGKAYASTTADRAVRDVSDTLKELNGDMGGTIRTVYDVKVGGGCNLYHYLQYNT